MEEEDEDYIVFYNSVIECGKRVKIYLLGQKKTCLGVLDTGDVWQRQ